MRYEDAVVLVPGFFGFGRLGDFFYFADRLAASIRSAVETEVGRLVPVLSIATEPAGSLAQRQKYLLKQLSIVDRRLEGVQRFHLFGHSTGGLDAELLTWERSQVDREPWPSLDPQNVRGRIASITTISAPFHGTHLCDNEVAGFLADPFRGGQGAQETIRLLGGFARMLGQRWLTLDALGGAAVSWSSSAAFLYRLLCYRDLIQELRPARMEALRAKSRREISPQIASFVVTTSRRAVQQGGVPRDPDDFFREIYALTGHGAPPPPQHDEIGELLGERAYAAIRNPRAEVPSFDASASDGVVNAVRQVLLPEPGHDISLGGIVIADHADVIGHYDRQDPLSVGWDGRHRPINKGFFRSGSGFGDDQFYQLYTQVGAQIARGIERGLVAPRGPEVGRAVSPMTVGRAP